MNQWLVSNLNFSFAKRQDETGISYFFKQKSKFAEDQIFEAADGLIILDGCLLNKTEIMKEGKYSSFLEYCNLHKAEVFWQDFRGPFSGCHIGEESLTAYTNQTGDTFVFWYCVDKKVIISNNFNLIICVLKENGIDYNYDRQSELYLLNYGFMLDDSTVVQEIKRLQAGTYLRIKDGRVAVKPYHTFSNKEKPVSFENAIELVDNSFKKAVKRCFEKDVEYGYTNHLADMSGGLDSRMVNWAAKELGYNHITNISYSQWGTDENKYAKQTSEYLNHTFLHMSLDYPEFLFDIDKLVNMNYGLSVYFGITGGAELLSNLNQDKFGLEHSGQIGDVVVGTFGKNQKIKNFLKSGHKYSNTLETEFDLDFSRFENDEIFNLYTRAFNGALSSHLIRREWFYTVSPFLDVDFLETCLSLPSQYRKNHKLYWAWIESCHKTALSIPSTRKRSGNILEKTKNRMNYFIKKNFLHGDANNMNPFEYWYKNNIQIRDFIEKYYYENIERYTELAGSCENVDKMFRSSNIMDKCMAINVLANVKRYFG
ncbi:asparagine synthase-related protein [uncultured Clostridium sp.]|uniref:asparagine synthase-related protein n=1 Tax=uncultured Clostridium sp. TaxID=59620 RepID=UPI0025F57B9F|nr:asparagine synthase-related protein [uncultured Clostridium sp.]